MPHVAAFHLGLHCLPKYYMYLPVSQIKMVKKIYLPSVMHFNKYFQKMKGRYVFNKSPIIAGSHFILLFELQKTTKYQTGT